MVFQSIERMFVDRPTKCYIQSYECVSEMQSYEFIGTNKLTMTKDGYQLHLMRWTTHYHKLT